MTSRLAPDLLVLGHVTRDEFEGGDVRPGGAAGFAARAAALLGVRTALVTAAPPDDPLLAAVRDVPGLAVHVVPSPTMTTFGLVYGASGRRLYLRARATSLQAEHIPAAFRRAQVVFVGPVAGECDGALVEALARDRAFVGACLQGWMRSRAADDAVVALDGPEVSNPPRGLRVATLSEEDHPNPELVAARFAAAGSVVAITRGSRGATLIEPGGTRLEIPAHPAVERAPTGAGDVFAVVLTLALGAGFAAASAARLAAEAAALKVEGPGLGRLAALDASALRSRLSGMTAGRA